MSYDVVLAGRGGQGVLFLSRVMGEAALRQGLAVRTTETHGMAMRGGSVLCFVRIGSGRGPLFRKGTASLLIALHVSELELGRPYLAPEASIIVNTPNRAGGRGGQIPIDADTLATTAGNARSANLVLLGAACTLDGFPLKPESVASVIMEKGPENMRPVNLEIFRLGGQRPTTDVQNPR
ncbi:MAG: 2-oxoacid:acceptor oxidoreductase family protein [bacterium]|nr:MAG: 2-oxoacid:acceptor oxidoreductase family protein [bacterium]